MPKTDHDPGIVYCNRVRIGNWYESTQLEEYKLNKFREQMKGGNLMLARFRKMSENLTSETELTQASGSVAFGAKICFKAPYVPSSDPPQEGKAGVLLGGRISSNNINYSQELVDGCTLVTVADLKPRARSVFIITSADYCNREGEPLKYYQEFLLTLASSVDKKPLYIRYDLDAIPGLSGLFPVYLSEHSVSNARWRILPAQKGHITRFEQEGRPVQVNTDIVINHCATNVNLGVRLGCWTMGFYGKVCALLMKTCLDIYGKEVPSNIWQIYVPVGDGQPEEDK